MADPAELALSATLAESTRTPYVFAPFHPINVGNVPAQLNCGFVLLHPVPLGVVLLDASKITWLLP